MQVGLMAPQGWKGEYDGWQPARRLGADDRARAAGRDARLRVALGLRPLPHRARAEDEITFESFSVLTALAMATERVRLGHMVVCTGFRNPALTAKMASTIDVISGGRFELGIGAGWKEEEWRAYGYGFPTLGERMARARRPPRDHPGDVRRRAARRYEGRFAHVRGAINVPKGLQEPRIPIIVGGNGERVTAGYAIRYADELNYVFLPAEMSPAGWSRSVRAARPRVATRRRSGSRSTPATRRCATPGQARVDTLAGFAEIGLDRIVCFPTRWSPTTRRAGGLRGGLPGGRA